MSLSRIQAIFNLSSSTATFTDHENKGPSPIQLSPANASGYSNTPVPWYNSKNFTSHNIEIQVGNNTFYVWQYGDNIYYSTSVISGDNPISNSTTLIGAAGSPIALYINAGATPSTMPWAN